jgi:hypothetical protein
LAPEVAARIKAAFLGKGIGILGLLRAPSIATCLAMLLLPIATFALGSPQPGTDDQFQITAWGPDNTPAGVPFNVQPNGEAAIWIRVSRPLDPAARIYFGDRVLDNAAVDGDLITAFIPRDLYDQAGDESVYVLEVYKGNLIRTNIETFKTK